MKKILIGTGNPAKFNRYSSVLGRFKDIEIVSPNAIGIANLPIIEDGHTAMDNAKKKATLYANATDLITLSIDEALYIDFLSDEEQPKTKVRRYQSNRDLSDSEMIEKFTNILKEMGKREVKIIWIFAICLAFPNGQVYLEEVEVKNIMIDTAQKPIIKGYPLSSIIFDPIKKKTQSNYSEDDWNEHLEPVYKMVKKIVIEAGVTDEYK